MLLASTRRGRPFFISLLEQHKLPQCSGEALQK